MPGASAAPHSASADSRPEIPAFPLSSPSSTRQAPDTADRLGLALNVGEELPVAIPLQPLLDEGPEDDLETHRELERGGRLPGQDARPVEDVLRENEKDAGLIREHHTASASCRPGFLIVRRLGSGSLYNFYLTYKLYYEICEVKPNLDEQQAEG